jgi:galactose mutarotase-like enzyme
MRSGVRAYVERRLTMGIPLLHPWANRLGAWRFAVGGREVVLNGFRPPLPTDGNGLPMHGLLASARDWHVERHASVGDGALPAARFDFAADDELMVAFPFAHELWLTALVDAHRLTVSTEVVATGADAVPLAFGFHPHQRCRASIAGSGRSRSRYANSSRWTAGCFRRTSARRSAGRSRRAPP